MVIPREAEEKRLISVTVWTIFVKESWKTYSKVLIMYKNRVTSSKKNSLKELFHGFNQVSDCAKLQNVLVHHQMNVVDAILKDDGTHTDSSKEILLTLFSILSPDCHTIQEQAR